MFINVVLVFLLLLTLNFAQFPSVSVIDFKQENINLV